MPVEILIVAINARYSHCSFSGLTLLANLGDLQPRAALLESDLDTQPLQLTTQILERRPRLVGEFGDALDREDLARQARQQRRLESRTGPDLEHPLPAAEREELQVLGVHPRLADGLPMPDRQWCVLVRAVMQSRGDEQMPRHVVEGLEHADIVDALARELLDETPPRPTELRDHSGCHHCAESSSRSRAVRSRCNGVTET